MQSVEFQINLHNQDAVYLAGDKITGSIEVRAIHLIELFAVKISVEGYGHVQWMDTEGGGRRMRRRLFTKSETYYKTTLILAGGNMAFLLDPGEYIFPFEINLPTNVPSSFEHELGRVRHYMLASLEIPIDNDKHIYQAITVVENINLNESSALNLPTNVSDTKTDCCFKTNPITATVILHRGGFAPGQMLSCDVTIDNQSSNDVRYPTLKLVEHLEFRALGKIKKIKRDVCALDLPKMVSKKSKQTYDNVGFLVPSIAPTSQSMDNVIESNYVFELIFKQVGLSFSKKIQIPVVIGSRPLVQVDTTSSLTSIVLDDVRCKPCHFTVLVNDTMPTDHPVRGQIIKTNETTYYPKYPNYS